MFQVSPKIDQDIIPVHRLSHVSFNIQIDQFKNYATISQQVNSSLFYNADNEISNHLMISHSVVAIALK